MRLPVSFCVLVPRDVRGKDRSQSDLLRYWRGFDESDFTAQTSAMNSNSHQLSAAADAWRGVGTACCRLDKLGVLTSSKSRMTGPGACGLILLVRHAAASCRAATDLSPTHPM